MTGTVIPWLRDGQALVATETLANLPTRVPRLKRVSLETGTSSEPRSTSNPETSQSTPIDRIYPHLFDQDQQAGQALIQMRSALGYAEASLQAFGEPDLDSMAGSLSQLAVALWKAYPLTEFNPSLGGVVAFVRRAVLSANPAEITRAGLNALKFVLRRITDNPMLGLAEAADAIDRLECEGWRGEHDIAEKIVAALLGDIESDESEDAQTRLFADAPPTSL